MFDLSIGYETGNHPLILQGSLAPVFQQHCGPTRRRIDAQSSWLFSDFAVDPIWRLKLPASGISSGLGRFGSHPQGTWRLRSGLLLTNIRGQTGRMLKNAGRNCGARYNE